MLWSFIYNILFIPIATVLVLILKRINPKMNLRESQWRSLLNDCPDKKSKRIWFHAASMGEFEQAKPVIELIKESDPNIEIIVSFYSPSGYENQKNYKYADHLLYMPFDGYFKANKFISKVNPDLVIFVRYEYWRNHLQLLKNRRIPVYLICATRPGSGSLYFPIFNSFFKETVSLFSRIYTVGKEHTHFFESLDYRGELIESSDTRLDRIIDKVSNPDSTVIKKENFNNDLVLIIGSSWPEDEQMIADTMNEMGDKLSLIIVPHEPNTNHLEKSMKYFPNAVLLSELENGSEHDGQDIIVDSIGKLLGLYSLGDIAYVGGAFGTGVHSVTEPAGFGLPIITGPRMENSPDAIELNKIGALAIARNHVELKKILESLLENQTRDKISNKSKEYVFKSQGWSKKIKNDLLKVINS